LVALEKQLTITKMKTENKKLNKSVTYLGITLPFLFLAPLLLSLGIKAIGRTQLNLGYTLVTIGILLGITAIILMGLGIKFMMNYIFRKEN